MKVLYISTMFPSQSDTIYTDLAESLRDAGHEVTVVATCDWSSNSQEGIGEERGMTFLRVKTLPMYNVNFIKKGISFITLEYYFNRAIGKYLREKEFSFILFESPPVTISGTIRYAKSLFNCPTYLMLKDIFPQNAVDLKIIKKRSLPYMFFKYQENKLYKVANVIGCMSEGNKRYILDHHQWLNHNQVEVFPNTKRIRGIENRLNENIRQKYGIPDNACLFLFGGNMGKPQYVKLLCEAVDECRHDSNIFFLFVGRGNERYKLEEIIKKENIRNAIVVENLPRDQYEQITRESDVGLIILDPRFTIPNYPSRILSYMEYAKPVIAATDKYTDLKELVECSGCGEWVWSGDSKAFISTIRKFSKSSTLKLMGDKGRKYIENNFSVNRSVEILENHFKN